MKKHDTPIISFSLDRDFEYVPTMNIMIFRCVRRWRILKMSTGEECNTEVKEFRCEMEKKVRED